VCIEYSSDVYFLIQGQCEDQDHMVQVRLRSKLIALWTTNETFPLINLLVYSYREMDNNGHLSMRKQ